MAVVLTVIGLTPWLVLTGAGMAFLVTGQHLPFGFPKAVRAGWRLRLSGLIYCAVGLSYLYLAWQTRAMRLDAVVGSCLALAAMLFYTVRQERAAASEAAGRRSNDAASRRD